ncbi:HNH endonuclease [Candidatus Saccharibacteria bacterium]|nr:HNH endonuclease [Candidatus Saccharibacteria bacterium]
MCYNKHMKYKTKRSIAIAASAVAISSLVYFNSNSYKTTLVQEPLAPLGASSSSSETAPLASAVLEQLPVKGRAAKTGYTREEFYNSWPTIDGCSLRQRIIRREMGSSAVISSTDNCSVISGEYTEPYTGSHLIFYQKSDFTKGVQIDHVVALSDAWQKGAQNLSKDQRYQLATDPLNLLAVDAKTNQSKSDGDAASWLPPNKAFRCQYVARQVSVKYKYALWVTAAEKAAIKTVLKTCPEEPAVGVSL